MDAQLLVNRAKHAEDEASKLRVYVAILEAKLVEAHVPLPDKHYQNVRIG